MKSSSSAPGDQSMSAEGSESAGLHTILSLAAGRISNRKLDHFNNWCCQAIRPYLTDRRSIAAARFVDRHVDDGWIESEERTAILAAARDAVEELREWWNAAPTAFEHRNRRVCAHAAKVVQQAMGNDLPNRGVFLNAMLTAYAFGAANDRTRVRGRDDLSIRDQLRDMHLQLQQAVLRDIIGDPLDPVSIDARWRTSDVRGLALGIYEDRAFSRMPILADALMDAGCEDERIIFHCRGSGPHVRGCWVVDLVLGKA
jgi:hypothetical protein